MEVPPSSRVSVDFIETKTVAKIPWVCDVFLMFDNNKTIKKNQVSGTLENSESVDSTIRYHTEKLEEGEKCNPGAVVEEDEEEEEEEEEYE